MKERKGETEKREMGRKCTFSRIKKKIKANKYYFDDIRKI